MSSEIPATPEACECEKPITSAIYESKDDLACKYKSGHLFSCVCQLLLKNLMMMLMMMIFVYDR